MKEKASQQKKLNTEAYYIIITLRSYKKNV